MALIPRRAGNLLPKPRCLEQAAGRFFAWPAPLQQGAGGNFIAAPTALEQGGGEIWRSDPPPILPAALAPTGAGDARLGGGEGPVKTPRGSGWTREPHGVAPRPHLLPTRGRRCGLTRSPSTVTGGGRYPGPSGLPSRGGADAPVPLQAPFWVSLVWDNPPQPPGTPTPPDGLLASQRGGVGGWPLGRLGWCGWS